MRSLHFLETELRLLQWGGAFSVIAMSDLVSQAGPTSAREVGLACETMSGQAPPPPDPVYTFRPHAGEIATLKYVNLETRGTLVSG